MLGRGQEPVVGEILLKLALNHLLHYLRDNWKYRDGSIVRSVRITGFKMKMNESVFPRRRKVILNKARVDNMKQYGSYGVKRHLKNTNAQPVITTR